VLNLAPLRACCIIQYGLLRCQINFKLGAICFAAVKHYNSSILLRQIREISPKLSEKNEAKANFWS